MGIEAGNTHTSELHFSQGSKELLQNKNYTFHELTGSTLAGILQRYASSGMRFRGEYWLSHDSKLLAQQGTKGIVAVNWRLLGLGHDLIDQNIELQDVRSDIPSDVDMNRGSLNDVLEVIHQYYQTTEAFPQIIRTNPEAYIVSSTGSGDHLLALGGFLSDEGIDIKTFPNEAGNLDFGTIPFVYPRITT